MKRRMTRGRIRIKRVAGKETNVEKKEEYKACLKKKRETRK